MMHRGFCNTDHGLITHPKALLFIGRLDTLLRFTGWRSVMQSQPISREPRSLVSILIVLAALVLFVPPPFAQAADQVVNDCADNGGATQLRAKLAAAQASGGG